MMRVLSTQQMQRLEQGAEAGGVSTDTLMERAGLAVASWAWRTMRIGEDVLVLVGSGNNGGDGLVAGRHLQDWGAHVQVYLCTMRRPDLLLAETVEAGAQVVDSKDDADGSLLRQSLSSAGLVVDAVLGTGRSRPWTTTCARSSQRSERRRPVAPTCTSSPSTSPPASTPTPARRTPRP